MSCASASSPTASTARAGTAPQYADTAHGVTGILYGGEGWGQLGAQAVGALTIIFVMGGFAIAFFKIQNAVMKGGIRPTAEVELEGMDIPEMGVLAYEFELVEDTTLEPAEAVS